MLVAVVLSFLRTSAVALRWQSGLDVGMPLLPCGRDVVLAAPGWRRRARGDTRSGDGTGGRVWPAAGAVARRLAAADAPRGGSIVELAAGTGALGVWAASALGGDLRLTDVDDDALALCRENCRGNGLAAARVDSYALGAPLPDPYLDASLVLAADATYDVANIRPLVETLAAFLEAERPPLVVAAHQHRPLASLLGGRSTLRCLKRALRDRGLAFHDLATESLFAKVVVFAVTRAGEAAPALAPSSPATGGATGPPPAASPSRGFG